MDNTQARTADYTILGFIYQFNKTLLAILDSTEESEITVEGRIEDIDVTTEKGTEAIQCKYHETVEKFTLSLIYKPVLQMMSHFLIHPDEKIHYRLYIHAQGESPRETSIGESDLKKITDSTNEKLKTLTSTVKDVINLSEFSKNFTLEFSEPLSKLIEKVYTKFEFCGFDKDAVHFMVYPNAINIIANISCKHEVNYRKVKKTEFLENLKCLRKTAISKWTLALKTKDQLLLARREQLKENLNKLTRLRYLLISNSFIKENLDEIVEFIKDFLNFPQKSGQEVKHI